MQIQQISNEGFFQVKSPRKNKKKFEYQHPSRQFANGIFTNIQQLSNDLNIHGQEKIWYKKQKGNYIYFKCKYCRACIHLKIQQEQIKFLKFSNIHNHNSEKFKKKQQRSILEFVGELVNFNNQTEIKAKVLSKFQISARRYYYIINKGRKQLDFQEIMNSLVEKGNEVRYHFGTQNKFPESILIFSQQMKKMYQSWGDVVCLDITYNLIRQKPANFRNYGMILFCGMDSNLRITIFAYGLICNQTASSFKLIITQFLRVYQRHPTSFITDEQISLKSAFLQLQNQNIYKGSHILDSFHILKNLRRKVPKDSFQIFRKLIRTSNQQRMNYHYEKLKNTKCSSEIIQNFQNKSYYYCLGKIPSNFIGFNCSSSRCQKMNDIIKSFIPRQVNYSSVFFKFQKILNHIMKNLNKFHYETKKYEDLFSDYGIKFVRISVQKKVFEKFIENYTRGLRLDCVRLDQDAFRCESIYQNYIVIPSNNKCECEYLEKTGIPCSHLIKCMWSLQKLDYLSLFNKRWIVSESSKIPQMRGRPKNSRRNMIK